jgi:hypothetical protein
VVLRGIVTFLASPSQFNFLPHDFYFFSHFQPPSHLSFLEHIMRAFSLFGAAALCIAPIVAVPVADATTSLSEMLFPAGTTDSWTTAKQLSKALPLSDSTLRPTKDIKELTHTYLTFEGKSATEAIYKAGSWNFKQEPRGGFSFYSPGPSAFEKYLSDAKEATFAYSVYFPTGFDFVKGGKLPGLCALNLPSVLS